MKKFLAILTFGFCTLAGFGAFLKRNVVEPTKAERAERLQALIERAGGDGIGPLGIGGDGADPKVQDGIERVSMPSTSDLSSEVKANPHGTPASLVSFAEQFSEHMGRAMSDEAYAERVMGFLENCASSDEAPGTVRVYCVKNGERLGARYPNRFSARATLMGKDLPKKLKPLSKAL